MDGTFLTRLTHAVLIIAPTSNRFINTPHTADTGSRCHWASIAANSLTCWGYLCGGPPEPRLFFQGGDWKASAEMHLTGWPCFILQCVRVQLQGWINQQLCPLEEISLKRGPIFWSFNTPGRWEHYSKSPKQRCKRDRWERDPPWGLEDKWKTGTVFNPFK